jgi:hypothetical protein
MQATLYKNFLKIKSKLSLRGFFEVSSLVFIFGVLFFSFTYLVPETGVVKAEVIENALQNKSPILEVHIANNGMVYLQGARVVSVVGTTVTVSTSWKNTDLNWTVITNESYYGKRHFGTEFYDSKGKSISVSGIKVGNSVVVSGDLDSKSKELKVLAKVIRL